MFSIPFCLRPMAHKWNIKLTLCAFWLAVLTTYCIVICIVHDTMQIDLCFIYLTNEQMQMIPFKALVLPVFCSNNFVVCMIRVETDTAIFQITNRQWQLMSAHITLIWPQSSCFVATQKVETEAIKNGTILYIVLWYCL